jgi:hypothetical protein
MPLKKEDVNEEASINNPSNVTSDQDIVWNNDWDDNDSIAGALESQQILGDGVDDDDEDIENEIRANLSSKITSSLHAYKIAGLALIITLISFTINTVLTLSLLRFTQSIGIRPIRSGKVTMGEAILYAVTFHSNYF